MPKLGNLFIESISAEISRVSYRGDLVKSFMSPFLKGNSKIIETKNVPLIDSIRCDKTICGGTHRVRK